MDDERKRKKYTLYLHPEKAADFQTLEAIESVPRSEERGYSVTKFDRIFLSCLYGSEHLFLLVGGLESISKLPVRQ